RVSAAAALTLAVFFWKNSDNSEVRGRMREGGDGSGRGLRLWGGAVPFGGAANDRARLPLPRLSEADRQRFRAQYVDREELRRGRPQPAELVYADGGQRQAARGVLLRQLQHAPMEQVSRRARRHIARAGRHLGPPRRGRARRAHLHEKQAAMAAIAARQACLRGVLQGPRGLAGRQSGTAAP